MSGLRAGACALAFGIAAFASTFSPRAFAYCRTITAPLPAEFPQTEECYQPVGSIPLWWSGACVGFSVQEGASKQISLADAESQTQKAFERWMGASCPGGGSPSIAVSDEGPVACNEVGYSEVGPNQHVVIFRDSDWPHANDPYNTLALTTVTFDPDTGEIYDADIEINTLQAQIVVGAPPAPGAYDFDAIITHEAGHFLGLAHAPISSAVMFAFYNASDASLTSDDISGVCMIYEPDGARPHAIDAGTGGVEEVTTEATAVCDPTPRHGFGSACGPMEDGGDAVETVTAEGGCAIAGAPGEGGRMGGATLALVSAALGIGIARRRRAATIPGMRRLRSFAFASFLAVGAGVAAEVAAEREAHASIAIAVLFDELVRDSSAAAIVTPYEQKAVWEGSRIITYTHVHADRPVAGSIETDLWVRTMGGTVGKIGQLVDGEPVLTVGHPGLLFLQPVAESGGGVYRVTARAQGQFPVVLDPNNVPVFHTSSAVGGLVPTPDARVSQISLNRAKAGLAAEAPHASEVLHARPVEDGVRDVGATWARIHGSK